MLFCGLLQRAHTSKVLQQALTRSWPDSRNLIELTHTVAHLAAFAMVTNREAMRFITNLLDHVQHGAAAIKHHGLIFLPVDVDNFFALGDGSQRLRGESKFF